MLATIREDESQSLLEEPSSNLPHSWNSAKAPRFGLHADRRPKCSRQRQGILGFCTVAVGLAAVVVLGVYMGGGFTPSGNDDADDSLFTNTTSTLLNAAPPLRQLKEDRSPTLSAVSALLGWTYFAAWSLSFYPQVWYNHQRRSVVGLSFDFQLLNILGYTCYSVFSSTLLWDPQVRHEYEHAFGSASLVTVQDAAFAIHGAVLTLVTIAQCAVFERGGQRVAFVTSAVVAATVLLTLVYALAVSLSHDHAGPEVFDGVHLFSWLCWVYWLGVVKLGVTASKYVPQAHMNCSKRSTVGWSIGNVLLDFTGGVLSLAQLLLDGATLGWGGVVGDPVKFCLGFVSMVFDLVFIAQHYCLFPSAPAKEEEGEEGKHGDYSSAERNAMLNHPPNNATHAPPVDTRKPLSRGRRSSSMSSSSSHRPHAPSSFASPSRAGEAVGVVAVYTPFEDAGIRQQLQNDATAEEGGWVCPFEGNTDDTGGSNGV